MAFPRQALYEDSTYINLSKRRTCNGLCGRYHCHGPYRWGNWSFRGVAGPRLTPREPPVPHCVSQRVRCCGCVCARVCMFLCVTTVCAPVYMCVRACMYACVCVHRVCTCVRVRARVSLPCAWVTCVRVDMHVCACVCAYCLVCTWLCVCTCTHVLHTRERSLRTCEEARSVSWTVPQGGTELG